MSITWNGVNSDTIGVVVERIPNRYVPTRRFSPQEVAGRNGNILRVDKSFPNVEQEYEVYLSAEAQGLPSVARACAEWLMGPDGYCRLEDSYDTTVYREAFLMGGYDLENILNKFGRCTITFSCKPQKYLLTGDTPISIPAGPTTYTGDVVQFDGVTGASITSLSTTISPIQDLHGYSSPWPAGGGVNRLNPATVPEQGGYIRSNNGLVTSNTSWRYSDYIPVTPGEVLYFGEIYANAVTAGTAYYDSNKVYVSGFSATSLRNSNGVMTVPEGVAFMRHSWQIQEGYNENWETTVYIIPNSSPHEFTPYSNLCPISGRTGVDAFVAPNASMWSKYKLYVDTGAASELMPVGKQITDTWKNTGGTEISFPWDVVHYTSGGDAFLKLHYAAPEALQFDAPEAIYYFDGTEPAGTYHIPIGSAYGTGWVAGHSIQFTLTAAPDEGDQLFIDCGTNNANNPTGGRTWKVFAAGDTTAKQTGTTSNGTGGTSLGTIGNVNAHRPNGRLNAISRVVYGYARWSQSAMRQYYNSDAAAGAWWTMQNPWDRPPTQAASLRGFLNGFSEDFLNHLEETEVVTALNSQEGLSETTEKTLDKIFLPSLEQMYINPELAGEGESWDYYKELAAGAGLTGMFQRAQTYAALITYNAASTSSAVNVFLRSCSRAGATGEWYVSISGGVYGSYAYYTYRACPSCKFKKSAPDGVRYTTDWVATAGTVYGGTLDVVSGVLTVDRANIASYNGEVINEPWLSSMDEYAPGATPTTGAQVVYTLATPLTYQLTAQEVAALVGENNVWTSSGPVSVTVEAPFSGIVTNPTPFEARPMLEVSGVGEITINGKSIQILESVSDFEIDCEAMEAEDNSKIYCMDFPELSGGENEIVGDSSITSLTVVPRWWIL